MKKHKKLSLKIEAIRLLTAEDAHAVLGAGRRSVDVCPPETAYCTTRCTASSPPQCYA